MTNIQLMQGDCLELMKQMPDKSVDMILCDLPYGTTACSWDSIIPFEDLWRGYERIITNEGAIVLFGSEPFSSLLRTSNIKLYKYDWVWIKNRASNFMNAKLQPLKIYENISVFSKAKASNGGKIIMNYFPQGITIINKTLKNSKTKGGDIFNNHGKSLNTNQYIQTYTNYPNNIIKYNIENGLHPTQKPVPLLKYLIKTYTNEGETVLDNCMGSGSTGVAAINLNRNFIGMELDEKYFEIAKNRIEEAQKAMK